MKISSVPSAPFYHRTPETKPAGARSLLALAAAFALAAAAPGIALTIPVTGWLNRLRTSIEVKDGRRNIGNRCSQTQPCKRLAPVDLLRRDIFTHHLTPIPGKSPPVNRTINHRFIKMGPKAAVLKP